VATGKELRTLHGHAGGVVSAQFSADGKTVVTASMDKTARLWEVATGKERQARCGHAHAIGAPASSADAEEPIGACRGLGIVAIHRASS